jgi:hypothetical protein
MPQSNISYESSDEEDAPRIADRVIRFGLYKDQKVSQVCRSKEGRSWLRWARTNVKRLDQPMHNAIDEQLTAYESYKANKPVY